MDSDYFCWRLVWFFQLLFLMKFALEFQSWRFFDRFFDLGYEVGEFVLWTYWGSISDVCGPDRTRTDYLCNANATLYQVSYGPICLWIIAENDTTTWLFCEVNHLDFILIFALPFCTPRSDTTAMKTKLAIEMFCCFITGDVAQVKAFDVLGFDFG